MRFFRSGILALSLVLTGGLQAWADPDEDLQKAAAIGDLVGVRHAIANGGNVNGTDKSGNTPIWWATKRGYDDVAKLLLLYGANPNQSEKRRGSTLLLIAANAGYPDMVTLLLAHGADPNRADKYGNTPLMAAAGGDHADVVKVLLTHGANVNQTSNSGNTSLWEAAASNHAKVVKLLLDHGAIPTRKDLDDSTGESKALIQSALNNRTSSVPRATEQASELPNSGLPVYRAQTREQIQKILTQELLGNPLTQPPDSLNDDSFASPIKGNGGGNRRVRYSGYIKRIQERFTTIGEYPSDAKARGITGRTLVTFTINEDGTLGKVDLTQSSGSRVLDDESLRVVKMADPYSPLPKSFHKNSLTLAWAFSYYNGGLHVPSASPPVVNQNSEASAFGSPAPAFTPIVSRRSGSAPPVLSRDSEEIRRLKRKIVELEANPPHGESANLSQEVADMKKSLAAIQTKISNPPPVRKSTFRYHSPVDRPDFNLRENRNAFAVVIGVEHYPGGIPSAEFADRDAKAVVKTMRALGVPSDHIKQLTDETATGNRINGALHWLARNVRPDSTVWVYFSGHGAPGRKGTAYLVPFDGDPTDLSDTGFRIATLYKKLNALKARHIIVAMDSCFSGQGSRSVIGSGIRPLVTTIREGAFPSSGKLVAFSAAKADQEAGVLKSQGHGLFTYYFLKGLDQGAVRQGHVTIAGLYHYLDRRVTDKANLDNRSQTPEIEPRTLGPDALVRLR